MKALIASLALTLALLIGIFACAAYASRTVEKMKSLVPDVQHSETQDKAFDEICSIWRSHKRFFSSFATLAQTDRVTEQLTRLRCAIEDGNAEEIRRSCALLLCALEDICRHERIF